MKYKLLLIAVIILAMAVPVFADELIPDGTFSYSIGNPVTFVSSHSEGLQFCNWDFGDGNGAQCRGDSITHEYETPGKYEVTYMIGNGAGVNRIVRDILISSSDIRPVNNRPAPVYPEETSLPIPTKTTVYTTRPTVAVTAAPTISTTVPTAIPTTKPTARVIVQHTIVTAAATHSPVVTITTEQTYPTTVQPTPTLIVTEIIPTPEEPTSWWDGIYQFFVNALSGFTEGGTDDPEKT